MPEDARAALAAAVQASGLVSPGDRGLVLVSGGADSAALLAGLAGVAGPPNLVAVHCNHGLRADSDEDEAAARGLCELLDVELRVERVKPGAGNVQDAARRARYATAERLGSRLGVRWIATGHTRTDLAETVLYRLASSPGARALLGLPARSGTVVRPLLALDRDEVRRLAAAAGLPWRDDPSNLEPLYARNRIRTEVLGALRELAPGVEATIAETRAELEEDSDALEEAAADLLDRAAGPGGALRAVALEDSPAAVRRRALRLLAERVAGRRVALGRGRVAEILRLAASPEGGTVELGGGLRAICESGTIRVSPGAAPEPEPAMLTIPGRCRFGRWEVRARIEPGPPEPAGPGTALLDPARLGTEVIVRSWQDGDRIRPTGLGGSKSLQDLFTDARVPRSLRRTLPVVVARDEVAWVAGLAVSESFAAEHGADPLAILTATEA